MRRGSGDQALHLVDQQVVLVPAGVIGKKNTNTNTIRQLHIPLLLVEQQGFCNCSCMFSSCGQPVTGHATNTAGSQNYYSASCPHTAYH